MQAYNFTQPGSVAFGFVHSRYRSFEAKLTYHTIGISQYTEKEIKKCSSLRVRFIEEVFKLKSQTYQIYTPHNTHQASGEKLFCRKTNNVLVAFQEYIANRHEDFPKFRKKMKLNVTACYQRAPLRSLVAVGMWKVDSHCIVAETSGNKLNTGEGSPRIRNIIKAGLSFV